MKVNVCSISKTKQHSRKSTIVYWFLGWITSCPYELGLVGNSVGLGMVEQSHTLSLAFPIVSSNPKVHPPGPPSVRLKWLQFKFRNFFYLFIYFFAGFIWLFIYFICGVVMAVDSRNWELRNGQTVWFWCKINQFRGWRNRWAWASSLDASVEIVTFG